LFQPSGDIVFVDFGCVQPLEQKNLAQARIAHKAALDRDTSTFNAAITTILGTRGGAYEQAMLAFLRRSFEPLFGSPFRMTRDFVREQVDTIVGMKRIILSGDKSFVPPRQGLVFLNRLQFGFYSVLARLDVEVDFAEVERRFLVEAGIV
jgi:hypothetical protein